MSIIIISFAHKKPRHNQECEIRREHTHFICVCISQFLVSSVLFSLMFHGTSLRVGLRLSARLWRHNYVSKLPNQPSPVLPSPHVLFVGVLGLLFLLRHGSISPHLVFVSFLLRHGSISPHLVVVVVVVVLCLFLFVCFLFLLCHFSVYPQYFFILYIYIAI